MITVNTWLSDRKRRHGPKIKSVYPARNVVDMASWRWAKAAMNSDKASDELRLAEAQYRAAEARLLTAYGPLIKLITSEVLNQLEHRADATLRRKSGKARPKPHSQKQ